jgi:hypothetical protein
MQIYSQEVGAIRDLKLIQTAQTQYFAQFERYASRLSDLAPPKSGPANSSAADLLPERITASIQERYQFTMSGSGSGYTVNAEPVTFNSYRSRTFFTDQTLVIRQSVAPKPATAASPEVH